MQETVSTTYIQYGKGKTRPCAELRFTAKLASLSLFLWLPHPTRKYIARMLVRTEDWLKFSYLDYCPKAFRYADSGFAYWQEPIAMLKAFRTWDAGSYGAEHYKRLLKSPRRATSISLLTEVALEHWVARL